MSEAINNITRQLAEHWRTIQRSAASRNAPATAIDIDGEFVHIAQAARRLGGAAGIRFFSEKLPPAPKEGPLSDKALGEAAGRALRKAGVRLSRVAMSLPRASVILRTVTLPKTTAASEMASMVQFQIGKDLPFRLDEAIVDFRIQSDPSTAGPAPKTSAEPPGNQVRVLVAAVKKEAVERLQGLARSGGFRLASIGLRSYASARGVRMCSPGPAERCILLVSLRPDETVIDILLEGEPAFSRAASLQAAASGDRPADTLVTEILRSLHSFEGMENYCQPVQILVAGPAEEAKKIASSLAGELKLPAEVLHPASALNLKDADTDHSAAILSAAGLAQGLLDEERLPFDFLNPKRPSPPAQGKRVKILAAAAAASILLCILAGVRVHMMGKRTALKNAVQQELTAASKSLPLYRQTTAQARSVKAWLAEEKPWLDHLAFLSSLLPSSEEMYVNTISTGDKGALHLLVKARHSEVITRLDAQLRHAGYDVKPPAITPSGDRYGYAFQASLELIVTDRLKIDLAGLQFKPRPEDDASMTPGAGRGGGQGRLNRNRRAQAGEGRGQ